MTDGLAERALALWGLGGARTRLVAERENRVYRVEPPAGPALALRLHRPGLRSPAEIASELAWMAWLAAAGLTLPRPLPALDGALCRTLEGTSVDVLTWLEGEPMGRNGRLALADGRAPAFRALGRLMARLHTLSDAWLPPAGFTRPDWRRDGLLGEAPLWGRFWENPRLTAAEARLLGAARRAAGRRLERLAGRLDQGLIHADLIPDNVVLGPAGPQLIDFDDASYGYRLFEIATTLNRLLDEPDRAGLQAALLEGYAAERPIDLAELPLFQALRAFTYVGWVVPRLSEPGSRERCARFIARACDWAARLVGSNGAEIHG